MVLDNSKHINRRSALKTIGAGSSAMALSGCLGIGGEDSDDTVTVGAVTPISGPYAATGQTIRDGLELAVSHANEEDDAGGKEVELEVKDSEVDPGTARQRANELIRDGADFITGNLSSGTGLALADLCQREEIPAFLLGGTNRLSGEDCERFAFATGSSSAMQTENSTGYCVREGIAEKVYQISLDYAAFQGMVEYNKQMIPDYGGEVVGNSFVPIGHEDYSTQLSKAQDSGADAIAFQVFGGDTVRTSRQAEQFGILDDMTCIWAAHEDSGAEELGQDLISHDNYYAALNWYWETDTEDARAYAESYRDEYGRPPTDWSASHYASVRTVLHAIGENDSSEPMEIVEAMEGREWDEQLWGMGEHLRECDHRATLSMPTVKGTPPEEYDEEKMNHWQVINQVDDPQESMLTCEEAGCTFE